MKKGKRNAMHTTYYLYIQFFVSAVQETTQFLWDVGSCLIKTYIHDFKKKPCMTTEISSNRHQ